MGCIKMKRAKVELIKYMRPLLWPSTENLKCFSSSVQQKRQLLNMIMMEERLKIVSFIPLTVEGWVLMRTTDLYFQIINGLSSWSFKSYSWVKRQRIELSSPQCVTQSRARSQHRVKSPFWSFLSHVEGHISMSMVLWLRGKGAGCFSLL